MKTLRIARRASNAPGAGAARGFERGQRDLDRLWFNLHRGPAAVAPVKVAALDRALTITVLWNDPRADAELQRAAADVVVALGPVSIPRR